MRNNELNDFIFQLFLLIITVRSFQLFRHINSPFSVVDRSWRWSRMLKHSVAQWNELNAQLSSREGGCEFRLVNKDKPTFN